MGLLADFEETSHRGRSVGVESNTMRPSGQDPNVVPGASLKEGLDEQIRAKLLEPPIEDPYDRIRSRLLKTPDEHPRSESSISGGGLELVSLHEKGTISDAELETFLRRLVSPEESLTP